MITITKERLLTIKQWRETYGPGSNVVLPAEEAEELARIALASLAVVSDERAAYELFMEKRFGESVDRRRAKNGDREYMAWDMALGWIIWCHRAAMLQGSQPVSQTYKLPVNTPCQDAPAHIWLQTAGVWPEDGELSELTWCSHNQHHDDTLYVRADLVNGNYPVTPDSWISCSERMPNDAQWCVVNTEYGYYAQCWSEGQGWLGDDISIPECDVINWMPLPEPPQG
ncbi:DUF551 domain-containing protein [Escherichia coli]|uniref:DUF551 domain-containing protein n=1 Tax=Escherichia coli TaxID=562 RepID=UPI0011193BC4|nr:DUF551 domain-containing protein [Escherichia coli]EEY5711427.1 DUF551 domain-containing protein [Escherichia coli]DAO33483.1 MAG TPA: Protein of unknown function (DUF551) [Caudoviricetes sp.]